MHTWLRRALRPQGLGKRKCIRLLCHHHRVYYAYDSRVRQTRSLCPASCCVRPRTLAFCALIALAATNASTVEFYT